MERWKEKTQEPRARRERVNSRRVVAVLVVACAVLAPLTGVAALGSDGHADRGHAGHGQSVVAAQEEPTDDPPGGNETTTVVQHRNPDERSQDGDIEQVRAWLVGQLSGRLGDSTLQLSQGEYEQARRFLGDDYDAMAETAAAAGIIVLLGTMLMLNMVAVLLRNRYQKRSQ